MHKRTLMKIQEGHKGKDWKVSKMNCKWKKVDKNNVKIINGDINQMRPTTNIFMKRYQANRIKWILKLFKNISRSEKEWISTMQGHTMSPEKLIHYTSNHSKVTRFQR